MNDDIEPYADFVFTAASSVAVSMKRGWARRWQVRLGSIFDINGNDGLFTNRAKDLQQ